MLIMGPWAGGQVGYEGMSGDVSFFLRGNRPGFYEWGSLKIAGNRLNMPVIEDY